MSTLRLYPGYKETFEHNSVRGNLFLNACFCLDSRFSSSETDNKFKCGGTIAYGDPSLEFLFRPFKVFRLHDYYMMLLDQCGHVVLKKVATVIWLDEDQVHVCCGTSLGYFFAFTFFLLFIFNCVDFWSSMFRIVLDNELAEKNVFRKLGDFNDGTVQAY